MDTCRIGERFPGLEVHIVDGGTLRLPDALRGSPAVLLFYRGHW